MATAMVTSASVSVSLSKLVPCATTLHSGIHSRYSNKTRSYFITTSFRRCRLLLRYKFNILCKPSFQKRRKRFVCKACSENQEQDKDVNDIGNSDKEALHSQDSTENFSTDQDEEQENSNVVSITSGSPLPGVKPPNEPVKISKATLDILKDQIFGFDTFFVTGQEPYEGGVLFKGNLRGSVDKSYQKINARLQEQFGELYKLFLLINPEDDRPVAVIVPSESLQPQSAVVPEWLAASTFGLLSSFTILLRNSPELQLNFLSFSGNLELWKEGFPGFLITATILGAHEIGHIFMAKNVGADLSLPYFIPSWQIGCFGAVTRITNILSNRKALLQLAAAGPLVGFAFAILALLAGFLFPPNDGIGVVVDASIFHDSFLVGSIAKLALGDVLKEGTKVAINPVVIWAWSGLLINAINSIPAGELDGGRIASALWGRKVWSQLTGISIGLLGISALFNDVALYWVILVLFLQRGPISPQAEEISKPNEKDVIIGLTVLLLGLFTCLPFPFPFVSEDML